MLPEVSLNYWAILVGVAISMFLGYIWYSKMLFGPSWGRLIGKSEEELKKASGASAGLAIPLAFVVSYVMAHIISYTDATTITDGLITGFWLWLGFVFTTVAMQNLFAQRPMKLTMINVGYHLVQFLALGALLASWK